MPVRNTEVFLAKIEVGFRIRVPVLVRWRNRLEPGEVLPVTISLDFRSYSFYARYRKDHRITIPKLVVDHLSLKPGMTVEVKINRETKEEEDSA
jgi:bifunctional DNA-binding transcriptional regulator/antitoxin component of YhaV-PrlF toxin-antitoxin module